MRVFVLSPLIKRYLCSANALPSEIVHNVDYMFIHNIDVWPNKLLSKIKAEVELVNNFVNEEEEKAFIADTALPLKRLRYEKDHWDNAIKSYREVEKKEWGKVCSDAINRVREFAFPKESRHLSYVHVLDLAADGFIKPHIDSVRYCGDTIAGLSLLSDSVMRLVHKDDANLVLDLLLKRRSLYVLRGVGRREFMHEVWHAMFPTLTKLLLKNNEEFQLFAEVCQIRKILHKKNWLAFDRVGPKTSKAEYDPKKYSQGGQKRQPRGGVQIAAHGINLKQPVRIFDE